jgi:hypothetical protein
MYAAIRAFQRRHELACSKRVVTCESQSLLDRSGLSPQMIAVPAGALPPSSASSRVTDYRDSGCGCCEGWAGAVKAAGYSVDVNDVEHAARLRRFSIPAGVGGLPHGGRRSLSHRRARAVGSAGTASSGASTNSRHRAARDAERHAGDAWSAYDDAHGRARCSASGLLHGLGSQPTMKMLRSALPATICQERIFTAAVDNRLFGSACAPEQTVSSDASARGDLPPHILLAIVYASEP